MKTSTIDNLFSLKAIFFFFFVMLTCPIIGQLSGTIYVGVGQTYTSFTRDEAGGLFKAINSSGVSGNIVVYITSDIAIENGDIALKRWTEYPNGSNYTLYIKPLDAVNRSVTGTYNEYALFNFYNQVAGTAASRVTIDGSFNNEGRYLTFANLGTYHGTKTFQFGGYSNNCTIKNCVIYTGVNNGVNSYGVYLFGTENNNITIENNLIYKARTGIWFQGNSTNLNDNNKIINNRIGSDDVALYIRFSGIEAIYQNNLEVCGNEVYNIISSDNASKWGIWIEMCTNTLVDKNNVHDIVYTGNLLYGCKGFFFRYPSSGYENPNLTVSNNMVSHIAGRGNEDEGYYYMVSQPAGMMFELNGGVTSGLYIYFNTINLNQDLAYGIGSQNSDLVFKKYSAIGIIFGYPKSGIDMRNNIISCRLGERAAQDRTTTRGFAVWTHKPLNAPDRTASPFSNIDYNIYYVENHDQNYMGRSVSNEGTDVFHSIADWQVWTGMDANSVFVLPRFKADTDPHLAPGALMDNDYDGTPIIGITTDFDGQNRNEATPFVGADEISVVPLPVELASFICTTSKSNIELKWETISEINNYGFEIERLITDSKSQNSNWETIGFVKGSGNSNSKKSYTFTDALNHSLNLNHNFNIRYRLKQIDNDGTIEYSSEISTQFSNIPVKFELLQNFPNPFNPGTKISFRLPNAGFVTMEIYNTLGEKIATLFSDFKEAGNYEYDLTANKYGMSSGMYICKLTIDGNSKTIKMNLIK